MKRLLFIAASFAFSAASFAQKSQIRTAKNALSDKEFEKAKTAIEAAVTNPETQNDANAWYTRGIVYLAMQQQPGNEGKQYYQEAGTSFKKAISIKSDHEKLDMNNNLLIVAKYNFNDGLGAYDKQNYTGAYTNFGEVVNIYKIGDGTRFANMKQFDTIARQAATYQGYSAYYGNNYDDALPLLLKAKTDPIVKDARNYLMIADIYESKRDDANLLAIINEAKTAYPNEQSIVNRELNYYVKSGKSDVLIAKLEDAIKAEPNNPELLFNLAIAYDNMANPKDKDKKDLPKPSNYNDLFAKTETAYETTVKSAPQRGDVFYNYGALYFNRAVGVNEQMNALGNTAADIKKYDGLKIEREQWFNKALPHFERVIAIMEPQVGNLKGEDYNTYLQSLSASKEIYAKQNKIDKATEMKKKMDALQK